MAVLRLVRKWATMWRWSRICEVTCCWFQYYIRRWYEMAHQRMVCVHQVLHNGQNCFRDLQDVKTCLWRGNNMQNLRFRICVYQWNVQKVAWIKGLHSTVADFEPIFLCICTVMSSGRCVAKTAWEVVHQKLFPPTVLLLALLYLCENFWPAIVWLLFHVLCTPHI